MQMTQTPLGKMMTKKAPKGINSADSAGGLTLKLAGYRHIAPLIPHIAMCMSGAATSGAGDSNL